MKDKEKPISPLLIVGITVLCVLLLVFLIFYFDWWRDSEPYMPLRPIYSSNYTAGLRNHLYFKQPSGLITQRI
jgi:hypothetical protein